jgi:hypothetical protein
MHLHQKPAARNATYMLKGEGVIAQAINSSHLLVSKVASSGLKGEIKTRQEKNG